MPKKSQRRNDTRRVNKDRRARLEEMRRQQRAIERRKNLITYGSAVAVFAILVGVAALLSYRKVQQNNEKKNHVSNTLKAESKIGHQSKPTAAEAKAGCTGVHSDPIPEGGQHVGTPIDYSKEKYGDTAGGTPPIPPSGGKHNGVSLGDKTRFYPLKDKPRPERAVHNLEHGYIVIWYDAKLPQDQVAKLQALDGNPSLGRVLVVGWWQGDLPADKHVVLTSWGKTDRCATVSADVITEFYTVHVNAPQAPEAGAGPIPGADSYPSGTLPPANQSPSPAPPASSAPSPSATSTKK